jgi:hypothetical protein
MSHEWHIEFTQLWYFGDYCRPHATTTCLRRGDLGAGDRRRVALRLGARVARVHGRKVGRVLAVRAQKVEVQIGDGRLVEARVEDAEVLLERRALAEAERLLGLERLCRGWDEMGPKRTARVREGRRAMMTKIRCEIIRGRYALTIVLRFA